MIPAESQAGSGSGSHVGPVDAGAADDRASPHRRRRFKPRAAVGGRGRPAKSSPAETLAPAPALVGDKPGFLWRYRYWLAMAPCLMSMILHVAGLLGMALMMVPVVPAPHAIVSLTSSTSDDTPFEEFTEVELDVPEEDVEFEQPTMDVATIDPGAIALGDVPPSDEVADVGDLAVNDGSLPNLGDLAGMEFGTGREGSGREDGAAMAATFFGKKSTGRRFVFVVDNSNSMVGGRFETALHELMKAVNAMDAKQYFYVIFYSDTAYGLFHPDTAPALVPATPENKQKLASWLATAEMCLHTKGAEAVAMALQLSPDVINILGDGAFSDKTPAILTAPHSRPTIVNTFGMGIEKRGEEQMVEIAKANRGDFTAVDILSAARESAKVKPIRRNSTRQSVWGMKLPAK